MVLTASGSAAITTLYNFSTSVASAESDWTNIGTDSAATALSVETINGVANTSVLRTGATSDITLQTNLGTIDYVTDNVESIDINFTIVGLDSAATGNIRYFGFEISDGSTSVEQWFALSQSAYDYWTTSTNASKFDTLNGPITTRTYAIVDATTDPFVGDYTSSASFDLAAAGFSTSSDLSLTLLGGNVVGGSALSGTYGYTNLRVTAVPEPTALTLLGLGGLALVTRRRR